MKPESLHFYASKNGDVAFMCAQSQRAVMSITALRA
jgi:hypothetical protein